MSEHRKTVAAALEALRIESPTSFSWFGESSVPLDPGVVEQMDADSARTYLRHGLGDRLYTNFYCSGQPVPRQLQRMPAQPQGASPFLDSLSRANRGSGSRESGWTVARVEGDGRLIVQRHGLSLWARPEEVLGPATSPGSKVSVTLPAELRRLSPGFYMALGDEELDFEDSVVRHYWHLSSGGGEALIAAATRVLNRERLPFRLKVLADPALYSRCDAGVLYTPRRLQAEVSDLLPDLLEPVAAHLRPGTPALTKPLADGLSVAESPPGTESFGMHRCELLADAAVRAFELGIHDTPERLALVEQNFEEQGIAFDRPYLNAGSVDDYELAA